MTDLGSKAAATEAGQRPFDAAKHSTPAFPASLKPSIDAGT